MTSSENGPGSARAPMTLIRGAATEEEVAAVVAVVRAFAAAAAARTEGQPRRVSAWAAPHRRMRATFPAGPGGWRASALPR